MIESYRQAGTRYLKTIRHFFLSPVGPQAIRWFAALLGLLLAVNSLNVVNSYVGRDFMTAISSETLLTGPRLNQRSVHREMFIRHERPRSFQHPREK